MEIYHADTAHITYDTTSK